MFGGITADSVVRAVSRGNHRYDYEAIRLMVEADRTTCQGLVYCIIGNADPPLTSDICVASP